MRYTAFDRRAVAVRLNWRLFLFVGVLAAAFVVTQFVGGNAVRAVDTDIHANIKDSTSTENLELQVVSIDESELQKTGEYVFTVRVRGVMMVRLMYNATLLQTRSIEGPFDEWQSVTFRMMFSGPPQTYELYIEASNNSQVQAQVAVTAEYEPEIVTETPQNTEEVKGPSPISSTSSSEIRRQSWGQGWVTAPWSSGSQPEIIVETPLSLNSPVAPGHVTMLPSETDDAQTVDIVLQVLVPVLASVVVGGFVGVSVIRRYRKGPS